MKTITTNLENCNSCPRNCGVNRYISSGYCKTDSKFHIASICIHKGEEPVISGKNGICNVFFSHCNLQCIYCQNHQIIDNQYDSNDIWELETIIITIIDCLEKGCQSLGFVSPSHQIPQMITIIETLNHRGYYPIIVYNTNGYDTVESLKVVESIVNVYLPDFKYLDSNLSKNYSKAADYPEIAKKAIKEMYRQKGSTLRTNDDEIIESGLIIRHLVLPTHTEQSIEVLNWIADELGTSVTISLMAQYYPTQEVLTHENLGKKINDTDYQKVIDTMQDLGFYKGWIQDLESEQNYRPDFTQKHPFE